MNYEISSDIK